MQIVKQSAPFTAKPTSSPESPDAPATERHIAAHTDLDGALVALNTPSTADGRRIDAPALDARVDRLVTEGAYGLVPGGSTGESTTPTLSARKQLTGPVVEAADGRGPVLAAHQ